MRSSRTAGKVDEDYLINKKWLQFHESQSGQDVNNKLNIYILSHLITEYLNKPNMNWTKKNHNSLVDEWNNLSTRLKTETVNLAKSTIANTLDSDSGIWTRLFKMSDDEINKWKSIDVNFSYVFVYLLFLFFCFCLCGRLVIIFWIVVFCVYVLYQVRIKQQ